jgi:hypothetical protein
LRLPGTIRRIGKGSFEEAWLIHVDLSHCRSLERLGVCAFGGCSRLQWVRFPVHGHDMAGGVLGDEASIEEADLGAGAGACLAAAGKSIDRVTLRGGEWRRIRTKRPLPGRVRWQSYQMSCPYLATEGMGQAIIGEATSAVFAGATGALGAQCHPLSPWV